MPSSRFAQRTFLFAGIYGVLVLLPQYFFEEHYGLKHPPAITHPEFFYGFIGVGLAWQVVFFIVSKDPIRFRPLMIPAIIEKASFGIPACILAALGRLNSEMLVAGSIDLALGVCFVVAYVRTPSLMEAHSEPSG